jgi:uncharacterized protein YfdQ (DUF2303 family)
MGNFESKDTVEYKINDIEKIKRKLQIELMQLENYKNNDYNHTINKFSDKKNIQQNKKIHCKFGIKCIKIHNNKCNYYHTEEEIQQVKMLRRYNNTQLLLRI